jgi:hypothetical protein
MCLCGEGSCNLPCDILKNLSAFKTCLVPQTTLSVWVIPPVPDVAVCIPKLKLSYFLIAGGIRCYFMHEVAEVQVKF